MARGCVCPVRLLAGVFLVLSGTVDAASKTEIIEMCASLTNQTLVFGMITKGNTELTLQRWRPTFEEYLGEKITGEYGCRTRLIPLQFGTYMEHTRNQTIDFIFPNPTAFQEVKDLFDVHEFASVKRNFGEDQELDRFGGVIMRKASRFTDIIETADILNHDNLTVCAVNPNAFGGWHIQWYEMLQNDIDVDAHFGRKVFKGNHEDPLRSLVTETCDIGVARTETFERLVSNGEMNTTDLFTIGQRQQEYNFPQELTTVLYPEWPIASLKHVPRALEDLIAIQLLTLDASNNASIRGNHAGFTFPYSYQPVKDMFTALDHYGDAQCPPGQQRQSVFPNQCEPCPPGYHSPDGDSTGCQMCPVGTYTNSTGGGAEICLFCPAGFTTALAGSVESDCIEEAETSVNFGVLIISILSPVFFVVFCMAGIYVYFRLCLGRQLSASELLEHFFQMFKSIGKFAFGLMDLVTDLIVIQGVVRDSDLKDFHVMYSIIGVTSIITSFIDLGISVSVSRTTLQYLKGDKQIIRQRSTEFMRKHVTQTEKKRGGAISPQMSSENLLAKINTLSDEEYWAVLFHRLLYYEKLASVWLVLLEDLPMGIMGILLVLTKVGNDCEKLPGGLLAFLISFGASCLFGGHRFFIASGILAQMKRSKGILAEVLGFGTIEEGKQKDEGTMRRELARLEMEGRATA